ncbi:hypothetical protein CVS40_7193 [Lucilia cuprina]|nr:hypothetical protein CVS40_7193 [Lucilia cuprina]
METLINYVRDAMRNTQEEFRREIDEIRRNLGPSRENRGTHESPGINSQTSNVNSNTSSASFFIKLKDWNVSFSGDEDVSDYLFKVDTLTERSQCPYDYVMANFHIFLKGKAETWFWMYIKQNPRATYPLLKRAITKQFGTLEGDLDILMKISARKHHLKESYDDFYSSLVRMNLKLEQPMEDDALIKIIRRNVRPELLNMTFVSRPVDLDSYRDLLREAERSLIANNALKYPTNRPRQVDEISVESLGESINCDEADEEFDPQIESLKVNKQYVKGDYSKIKCWNCLRSGHSYIYCPETTRFLFCFKCGHRDVTTPECNNAHPENRRRSEQAIGSARSTS